MLVGYVEQLLVLFRRIQLIGVVQVNKVIEIVKHIIVQINIDLNSLDQEEAINPSTIRTHQDPYTMVR
jgi:hypothetical protein